MTNGRHKWILFFAFFAIVAFAMFGDMLWGERLLLTTDAAIAHSDKSFGDVFSLSRRAWSDTTLLGTPGGQGFPTAFVLNAFVPDAIVYNNVVYVFACLLSSLILLIYLSSHCGFWPSLLGAIASFWVGSNFSLLYAGHNHKPYTLMLFLVTLLLADKYAKSKKFPMAVLVGAGVGLLFCQQPDVATFYAIFSGIYILVRLFEAHEKRWVEWIAPVFTIGAMALMFAALPLLSGYNTAVKNVTVVSDKTPEDKWNYITQWSCPPQESIDFIAPGYTGWRSGDAEGPYWGVTGQTPGWTETGKGFRNFKLESTYIGFIPIALGCIALFLFSDDRKRRITVWTWGGIALLSLLLAFGKFFPLYRLFVALPVVDNIRNPNKFIQIFQLAVGVLSAYGLSAILNSSAMVQKKKGFRLAMWAIAGVGVLLLVAALSTTLSVPNRTTAFIESGWPKAAASVMAENRANALWHAALMALLLLLPIAAQRFIVGGEAGAKWRHLSGAFLVLVLATDAVRLSRHYIKEMPKSYVSENALIRAIEHHADHQRVALPSQQGIYSIFSTYMFPFHRVEAFNAASMPRMPGDYESYLNAVGKSPFALWRCSAVGLIVGPMQFAPQLAPQQYKPVFRFNVSGDKNGGLSIRENAEGQHALFKTQQPGTRFLLVGKATATTNMDEHAAGLLRPGAPFDHVSIAIPDETPTTPLPDTPGSAGTVDVLDYRAGKIKLSVNAERDCILRFAERYDPKWKATIDGKEAPVWLSDMICQAIPVSKGEHSIVLAYRPNYTLLYVQFAGMLFGLTALVAVCRPKSRRARSGQAKAQPDTD
jgi:hypothetical protein